MRTGITLGIAAIAVGACGSNRILFLAEPPPDDAGTIEPRDARASSIEGALKLGAIAKGPDGNLWFLELAADLRVGRISPAGDDVHFALDATWSSSGAGAIIAGPDGDLWFVAGTAQVGRMTIDGALETFPLPAPTDTADAIVVGPDGNLWFRGSSQNS